MNCCRLPTRGCGNKTLEIKSANSTTIVRPRSADSRALPQWVVFFNSFIGLFVCNEYPSSLGRESLRRVLGGTSIAQIPVGRQEMRFRLKRSWRQNLGEDVAIFVIESRAFLSVASTPYRTPAASIYPQFWKKGAPSEKAKTNIVWNRPDREHSRYVGRGNRLVVVE